MLTKSTTAPGKRKIFIFYIFLTKYTKSSRHLARKDNKFLNLYVYEILPFFMIIR